MSRFSIRILRYPLTLVCRDDKIISTMPQYPFLKNPGAVACCLYLFTAVLFTGCETFPLLTDPNLFSPSNLLLPDNGLSLRDPSAFSGTEPKPVNVRSSGGRGEGNLRTSMLVRGMSPGVALNVLLGEGLSGRSRGFFKPSTYRMEMMKNGGRLVEVYYVPNASNDPSAGETPLVFDSNQLVGWGWDYYYNNLTP
ncbi:MAG: hypothetical protein WC329_02155 [Candidatus Omnitrophota bacterium]